MDGAPTILTRLPVRRLHPVRRALARAECCSGLCHYCSRGAGYPPLIVAEKCMCYSSYKCNKRIRMVRAANKNHLDEYPKSILDNLHSAQITAEVTLATIVLGVFTLNLGSIWPVYGAIDSLVLAMSCLVLLICGILITSRGFELSKMGEPVESSVEQANLKSWLVVTWCWVPVYIAVVGCLNTFASDASDTEKSLLAGAVVLCFFINVIYDLIITQSLWKRFNRRKRAPARPITYSALAAIMLLLAIFGSYTTATPLEYADITNSDSNLELGQSEIRQHGKDGQKQTVHNLIFGFSTSTTQTDPVDQITAKGTRRYQYMYCSDGSYRYYTADQFKDPNVGFTHKSPDACAKNNAGTEMTIADTPPAKTQTTYVPTYRSSTSTHCYSSLYGSSFDCYSY